MAFMGSVSKSVSGVSLQTSWFCKNIHLSVGVPAYEHFFRPGTGPCQGFTESRLHLGKAQASLALLSVCTAFRDSNTVTNRRASRMQNQTEFELC